MQATNLLAIYFAQVFIGDTVERGYHASINLSLSLSFSFSPQCIRSNRKKFENRVNF